MNDAKAGEKSEKKRPGALPLQVFIHVIARITVSGPSESLLRTVGALPARILILLAPSVLHPEGLGFEYN